MQQDDGPRFKASYYWLAFDFVVEYVKSCQMRVILTNHSLCSSLPITSWSIRQLELSFNIVEWFGASWSIVLVLGAPPWCWLMTSLSKFTVAKFAPNIPASLSVCKHNTMLCTRKFLFRSPSLNSLKVEKCKVVKKKWRHNGFGWSKNVGLIKSENFVN